MSQKVPTYGTPSTSSLLTVVILMAVIISIYHYSRTRENISSTTSSEPTNQTTSKPTPYPLSLENFPEISRIQPSGKQIVFTFDGGSGDGSTIEILETLKKHHVKGTFFFVGKWVEQNPELTRRVISEGHEIFNHSYSHPYFTKLTAEEIKTELQKMDDTLYATAGVRTRPYYRPPYGDRNDSVNRAAAEAGYQSIYWSVDSLDWREDETVDSIRDRVLSNIHPGAIVLMHVGNDLTGQVIDEIFTTLEEKGYKLVSLTEALGIRK